MDRKIHEITTYRVESVEYTPEEIRVVISDGNNNRLSLLANEELFQDVDDQGESLVGLVGKVVNVALVTYDE